MDNKEERVLDVLDVKVGPHFYFTEQYNDEWNQQRNNDIYYIPVYPTEEEEKQGEEPCFIGVGCFLQMANKRYIDALSHIKSGLVRGEEAIEYLEECRLMVENSYRLCGRIINEDLAIPKTLITGSFNEKLEALSSVLQDENPIRIRHYDPIVLSEPGNLNNSRFVLLQNHEVSRSSFEIHKHYDENEFLFTWQQYKKAKEIGYPVSSFEEYLRIWTKSEQRRKWIEKQDYGREESSRIIHEQMEEGQAYWKEAQSWFYPGEDYD